MLSENVQQNTRAIRVRKKMRQEDLAAKAELSLSYISEIERGNRSPPLETVEKLADGLGVSPFRLLANPK